MPGIMQVGGWGAGLVAVMLVVLFGPVFAGYVFVAAAFLVIAMLMAQQIARAIDDWRLDHPWTLHRTGHRRS